MSFHFLWGWISQKNLFDWVYENNCLWNAFPSIEWQYTNNINVFWVADVRKCACERAIMNFARVWRSVANLIPFSHTKVCTSDLASRLCNDPPHSSDSWKDWNMMWSGWQVPNNWAKKPFPAIFAQDVSQSTDSMWHGQHLKANDVILAYKGWPISKFPQIQPTNVASTFLFVFLGGCKTSPKLDPPVWTRVDTAFRGGRRPGPPKDVAHDLGLGKWPRKLYLLCSSATTLNRFQLSPHAGPQKVLKCSYVDNNSPYKCEEIINHICERSQAFLNSFPKLLANFLEYSLQTIEYSRSRSVKFRPK